ncbi:helix-turn-helix transcriptional regulator [Sphingobium sp. CR2-8]|uniref:helix-turn-helix domain-containing protein n=1 Tax=Sphingobium sp. CR2-8 TaxID=1306534 RepID=UPI002DBF6426|nr:helix-turn-helix transcriptional regulator [Sphingobium sp. CR2-8]MEC3912596.1 helix-turn-helix transcriptional regulator [Sphingobium sp. CR2-8]
MPNIATERHIAARVTEAREYLELSADELAEMIGVAPDEIEAIEAGTTQVSATQLSEIAKALGRGIEFFTTGVSAQKASERTEFLARAAETLSDQDMGELQRFATYLRSRSESATT